MLAEMSSTGPSRIPAEHAPRTGWQTSMIKAGDVLSVEGATARDGSNHLLAREITLPDTKKLYWGPER